MSLKERIQADNTRVFMNHGHFAEYHAWNGKRFECVRDDEVALKRKNNNVVDVSWDNNSSEVLLYTPKDGFPGRALPNEHIIFDNKPMRVLQVQEDMGILTILLASYDAKAVANT